MPAKALQTARFVAWADLAWQTHNISVCFWNGTSELQDFVMETASVWSDAANLTLRSTRTRRQEPYLPGRDQRLHPHQP